MTAYLLNLLDLAFTLHAIRNGAYEVNPLMRCIPVLIVYKIVVIGMLCWWLSKRNDSIAKYGRTIITVVYAMVDIWHIINLIVIGGNL